LKYSSFVGPFIVWLLRGQTVNKLFFFSIFSFMSAFSVGVCFRLLGTNIDNTLSCFSMASRNGYVLGESRTEFIFQQKLKSQIMLIDNFLCVIQRPSGVSYVCDLKTPVNITIIWHAVSY
jgi:hypothetical protein